MLSKSFSFLQLFYASIRIGCSMEQKVRLKINLPATTFHLYLYICVCIDIDIERRIQNGPDARKDALNWSASYFMHRHQLISRASFFPFVFIFIFQLLQSAVCIAGITINFTRMHSTRNGLMLSFFLLAWNVSNAKFEVVWKKCV